MTVVNSSDRIVTDEKSSVNAQRKKEGEKMKLDKRKLEIAMARAKLNRDGLAAESGLPNPTVCTVYQRCTCKPATAGRIADALGVDVTEILED